MKTVVSITGIRPDFIRMSEVFHKLDENFNHIMIHTGQHYDTFLSDSFFRDLKIRKPDFQLSTGTQSSNHYQQLSYLSTHVINCLKDNHIQPDVILFLGDSNTSAVSLPLKKEGYIIGHIEAGMRSYDRRMLEEINRTVCDICTDVFFVYHDDYKQNLLKENIHRPIYIVGNTVVEPCLKIANQLNLFQQEKRKDIILMDIHRPENFQYPNRLTNIFRFANLLIQHYQLPIKCLYFPRLKVALQQFNIQIDQVEMIPLMTFPDYLTTIYHSKILISDSGTGQEEPALIHTPVIVPRDFTERPQSFQGNCSIQLKVEEDLICQFQKIEKWIYDYENKNLQIDTTWLGNGNTSQKIIDGLIDFLN